MRKVNVMSRMTVISRFYVVGMFIFLASLKFNYCKKLDPDLVKNVWIPGFSKTFDDFTEDVLAYERIKKDIENHRKSDKIKNLSREIDNEIFQNMCQKIGERFEKIKSAVFNISTAHTKTTNLQGLKFVRCCKEGPTANLEYNARLRQEVNIEKGCVGSKNGTDIPKIDIYRYYDVFKRNFDDIPSVLWQYFGSIDGDFVEYPDSRNHQCDGHGNTISPLLEDWFAMKHTKTEKNLVIVYDVGSDVKKTKDENVFYDVSIETVSTILQILTPNDKVNVVGFSNSVYIPVSCADKLFIANQRNKDLIREFIKDERHSSGVSDYSTGLEAAYRLLSGERTSEQNNFTNVMDIVMLITDGKQTKTDISKLFNMIEEYQKLMGRSVAHVVYAMVPTDNVTRQVLTNIAEQHVPNWPVGLNITLDNPPTEPNINGDIKFFTDMETFPVDVGLAFVSGLPETTNTDKTFTVIAPIIDKTLGLKLTLAVPVTLSNGSLIGTAAIDVSMATLFSDVENFVFGIHSYAFLLEKRHGYVLLHPKLKDPADTKSGTTGEPTFPSIRTVEPDLKPDQIHQILSNKVGSFDTKIRPGRTTFMTNDDVISDDASVLYQHLAGTQFVIVLVMFHSDQFLTKPKIPVGPPIPNAAYHRVDIDHDFPVCNIDGHIVTKNTTTVKLSPSVFTDPELYKFTDETRFTVGLISGFLKGQNNNNIIKEDLKREIWHSLLETQHLADYWQNTKEKVIERFFGSPNGVFKMFPGVVLSNTFDHLKYQWYQKTVSRHKETVVSSGKISEFTKKDVVIVTKALTNGKTEDSAPKDVQGILGYTISHRRLTSFLYDNAFECNSPDIDCYLLDDGGHRTDSSNRLLAHLSPCYRTFLNYGTTAGKEEYKVHLTSKFPWLAISLLHRGSLKAKWCTSMSEGLHKLSYSLQISMMEYDTTSESCKQFVIATVPGTNIYILALLGRESNNCQEHSTQEEEYLSCGQTFGRCTDCESRNSTMCQCPCYCDVDFDQCDSQFDVKKYPQFPYQACFYRPLHVEVTEQKQVLPTKLCSIPCQTLEDENECKSHISCKWTEDIFPICSHNTQTTTQNPTKIFIPTKPAKNNSGDHSVSGSTQHATNNNKPTKPGRGTMTFGPTTDIPIPTKLINNTDKMSTIKPKQTTNKESPTKNDKNSVQIPTLPTTDVKKPTKPMQTTTTYQIPTKTTTNQAHTSTNFMNPTKPSKQTNKEPTTHKPEPATKPTDVMSSHPSMIEHSETLYTELTTFTQTGVQTLQPRQSRSNSRPNTTGLAIGLTIVTLLLICLAVFVTWKFFGKTIKQSFKRSPAGKYIRRNSIEDEVVFHGCSEEVSITKAHSSTVPYGQM